MKIVLQHPTGNMNVRAILSGLLKAGMLAEFYTTISTDPKSSWLKIFPSNIRAELLRRSYPVPTKQINSGPALELLRMILPKVGLHRFTKTEMALAGIDSVYKSLDKRLARNLSELKAKHNKVAVYAYEDGALKTFRRAKELGLKCIYDLPIAFWELRHKLMNEEAERLPAWAVTLGGAIADSTEKLNRKTTELELADCIICPSQFVIDSLPKWAGNKKTLMVPFGSPQYQDHQMDAMKSKIQPNRPLRILFAGSMGQRKGLGDLFAAIKILNTKNVELVVMGSLMTNMNFYKNEIPDFIYEPGRPHAEVLKLMQTCDVFCLPSIVEGRALVMQEAMSQGLPIIITPNTGGEDLIKEGTTGFLVPIRSPGAIAEKINWFLDNRSRIREMGNMAQGHSTKYSWERYEGTIISGLSHFLS
jgi:glycosyltransferase involved in cell wall biosynthesis